MRCSIANQDQDLENRLQFLAPVESQPQLPLFIYLPGMDGTGELFYTQAPNLAQHFDIRCLHIPTHDHSDWSELVAGTIQLIRAELDQRHNPQIYLCGESFGGCLGLKLAVEIPELLSHLILINPASSFSRHHWVQWGSSLVPWLPKLFYPASILGLLPFLASLGRMTVQERQALIRAMRSVPQETSVWRMNLLREFKLSELSLNQLLLPVLLIAGKADLLLPSMAEVDLLTQQLINAQTAILPQSGHACLLETAVNLYEVLQDHQVLQDAPSFASNVLESV
ncbi:MAG: alpha/beta hydrolase [Oscillatoriales cyanobacterium RM1_1_9]|nr:alpha/beta hydrolase [Oscillatoriales cyanobacterium SM2_3_0]NJO46721.1 alpha/beta hydrolase [Oscillatoriales cyanobacterium RM2_1_1]NJO72051.1 alpha/beta hydrolase [Oscillatoriales cyanobacterium RM1_1_9]